MGIARCIEMDAMDSLPSSLSFGGGLSIELLGRGKAFFGLGRVSQDGLVLRSGRRPMFIEIRNPYGVELLNYCVAHCRGSRPLLLLDGPPGARIDGMDAPRGPTAL